MKIRTVIGGAVAAQLIFAGSGTAAGRADADVLAGGASAFAAQHLTDERMRAPGAGDRRRDYIQLAQAADPKVLELEEQVRQLNGQLEELNFQVLQMQDQVRKMQEDNEFRFQQLEGGSAKKPEAATGAGGKRSDAAPAVGAPMDQQARGDAIETIIANPQGNNSLPPDAGQQRGEPPHTLGTVTFDARGNAVQTAPQGGALPGVTVGGEPKTDDTNVASLPATGNPDELYRTSYEMILSGDYAMAEAGFRDHIARFPKDAQAADARFWLGEALLGQDRYREAAQVFLEANRDYPKAKKAPDAMLKLGVALAAMKQRDVACATLAELPRRYPQASPAILQRAKEERSRASC